MASRFLSRVLNYSIKNIDSYSFSQYGEDYDSFTTFHFNEEENVVKGMEKAHDLSKTSTFKEMKETSFSKLCTDNYEHFETERKYLGQITSVNNEERVFSANIAGVQDFISREIVFSMDDIPSEEIKQIDVGRRIIYIYGKLYRNGTATNISKLYFRKEGNWTMAEIERKRMEAEELYDLLKEKTEKTDD